MFITATASLCLLSSLKNNPSNANSTFVQSTRMQRFLETSKPCHVGIHRIALAECSQIR